MVSQEGREIVEGIISDLERVHQAYFAYNSKLGLYYYQDGIYHEDSEDDWIRSFIRSIRRGIDVVLIDEIVQRIKELNYKPMSKFNENINLISLLNQNYNLETNKAEEFTPAIINTSRFQINIDPSAKCPEIDKFFNSSIDKEDIPVVEELFGFLLSKRYEHKYLFLFHGGIDSGKSTLLEEIEAFLGGNVSHVEPHLIVIDRFAAANLYGKLANISGDISGKLIHDTSILKRLIGNDGIQANPKFEKQFTFRNHAKLIFAANMLPTLPDAEMEIFSQKVKVIRFPFSWSKDKQDKSLLAKMTTPEELSGLFNKALEGRKRLIKQGDFSNPKTKEQMMEQFLIGGDPVIRFRHDIIETSVTDITSKDDIRKSFKEYCDYKRITYPKSDNTFWKTLKQSLPKEHIDFNRRVGSGQYQKYAIGGIRLKSIQEFTEEQQEQQEPEVTLKITPEHLPHVTEVENIPMYHQDPDKLISEPEQENPYREVEPEYYLPDTPSPMEEPDPELQTPEEVARINALLEEHERIRKAEEEQVDKM